MPSAKLSIDIRSTPVDTYLDKDQYIVSVLAADEVATMCDLLSPRSASAQSHRGGSMQISWDMHSCAHVPRVDVRLLASDAAEPESTGIPKHLLRLSVDNISAQLTLSGSAWRIEHSIQTIKGTRGGDVIWLSCKGGRGAFALDASPDLIFAEVSPMRLDVSCEWLAAIERHLSLPAPSHIRKGTEATVSSEHNKSAPSALPLTKIVIGAGTVVVRTSEGGPYARLCFGASYGCLSSGEFNARGEASETPRKGYTYSSRVDGSITDVSLHVSRSDAHTAAETIAPTSVCLWAACNGSEGTGLNVGVSIGEARIAWHSYALSAIYSLIDGVAGLFPAPAASLEKYTNERKDVDDWSALERMISPKYGVWPPAGYLSLIIPSHRVCKIVLTRRIAIFTWCIRLLEIAMSFDCAACWTYAQRKVTRSIDAHPVPMPPMVDHTILGRSDGMPASAMG